MWPGFCSLRGLRGKSLLRASFRFWWLPTFQFVALSLPTLSLWSHSPSSPACIQITFCLSCRRTLGIWCGTHLDIAGLFPHLQILNHICKDLFILCQGHIDRFQGLRLNSIRGPRLFHLSQGVKGERVSLCPCRPDFLVGKAGKSQEANNYIK